MAHFAELESKTDPTGFTSDTHLVVKQVTVVANDVSTAAGPLGENDMHADGETWCVNFFGGGTFKQTSYNNNFRKKYAGIGDVYDASKNKFLSPKKFTHHVSPSACISFSPRGPAAVETSFATTVTVLTTK